MRLLIDRPDGTYCFRLHKDRVFYASEKIMKQACMIERKKLICFGTCFGKFTKTQRFRLHITALDYLAPYAKVRTHHEHARIQSTNLIDLQCKVWLKPNAEQQFLYGNHILKSGIGRITEGTGQYQGVVVYSMNDLPIVSLPQHPT